ncbi:hypothetical protein SPICUR_00900 [Spiribacter curvatus]|uniref:Prepilin-type N-terminal cleavage/methylation domain-containing protein n=1 Tax=Spiribacter curvatus TaxID=1335757 RepID=U5T1C9_9GAMM|nr:prepilin-type N-terminal cleavage/methylation domain-containing protein [Spiribacter curvatus]AGY91205.1 hypothetical protein SPICUR_00900 [Spiribacter curvatus]
MNRFDGFTLIELVIALVIIGISAATIASLLITALNFSANNQSYAERLRAAESCYETLLAVQQHKKGNKGNKVGLWKPPQPQKGCSSGGVQVTDKELAAWTTGKTYNQLFTSGGNQDICVVQEPSCEIVKIGETNATKFTIPIQGKNSLQLIVP